MTWIVRSGTPKGLHQRRFRLSHLQLGRFEYPGLGLECVYVNDKIDFLCFVDFVALPLAGIVLTTTRTVYT
jgi:hypothetical protein